jgi:spermidine/putrescine-binding protein
MKTKEQKVAEAQRELDKKKTRNVWIVLLLIVFTLLFAGIGIFCNTGGYGILAIIPCFIMAITFPDLIWGIDMKKCEGTTKEKLAAEVGYLKPLKEEYEYLCIDRTIDEIPANLRQTARYLLSDLEKSPGEIIKMREELVEDLRIQLQVYQTAPEGTFWRYVKSKKWLKKS